MLALRRSRRLVRSREQLALGGAVVAHLLVLAAMVRHAPAMRATGTATGERKAAEAASALAPVTEWIEAPELVASSVPAALEPGRAGPLSAERGALVASVSSGARGASSVPIAAVTAPGVLEGTAPPAEPGEWSLSTTRVDVNVGNARFAAGAAAGTAARDDADPGAAAAASGLAATNALLEGISAHDIAVGTSRGGPLLAAVEEAAHRPDAPSLGVAVFDITVSKSGAPHVSLVESKDNPEAWTRLGAEIATLTAKRQETVHIPESAAAIRVRIRVEAVDRLADGSDASKFARGARSSSHVGGTLERTGRLEDLPHAEVSTEGKFCNVHAGGNLLGPYISGGCSAENTIPARRIVAARILSETRL